MEIRRPPSFLRAIPGDSVNTAYIISVWIENKFEIYAECGASVINQIKNKPAWLTLEYTKTTNI